MDNPAITRLHAAVTRLERAMEQRSAAARSLEQRHAVLKARMTEAIDALDQVIGRAGNGAAA